MSHSHLTAPTQYIEADGIRYAYRRWGKKDTVPLLFIIHYRGGMDHWDPLMTDGLAEGREVILMNGRGVASSSGTPRNRAEDMADDFASAVRALGIPKVDVVGFSIGGFQAQELALRHPDLVRKVILLGTGPRGGDPWIDPKMADVAPKDELGVDDFLFLFFGRSEEAKRAGRAFWARRHERKDQDPASSPDVAKAQWELYQAYMVPVGGDNPYGHLNALKQPTLVVNGIEDIMIATVNSLYLGQHIPNAQVILYPDSGHGAHFQYPDRFLKHATQFLDE
ncbi:alpha/beta fold hydrolase [Cupriavidus plantarum]|uniref:Pimeloyl-ACP methyl ester carboxylesterase n=1 Tax=Cupriavidus plantarum TaxID=942865 RepID=A0A316ERS4_9BURK|nr:alpha/beta hydrolase [Cupriavidus plantarum]PWK34239.1 pimeloyl-ACP methyl ester carboxylesterase [Cupriavidus plantarum]